MRRIRRVRKRYTAYLFGVIWRGVQEKIANPFPFLRDPGFRAHGSYTFYEVEETYFRRGTGGGRGNIRERGTTGSSDIGSGGGSEISLIIGLVNIS